METSKPLTEINPVHRATAPGRTLLRCVNTADGPSRLGVRAHPRVLEILHDRVRQPVSTWHRYNTKVAV